MAERLAEFTSTTLRGFYNMRFFAPILIAAVSVVGLQAPAHAKDMDCANFPSQKAAQLFFLNNNPAADPHRLDSDGDWVVCESNPGPYYYGKDPTPGGSTGGGGSTPAPAPQPPAPIKVVRVIDGELVRVRQGSQPSYVVHLMGVKVPDSNSCKKRAARDDLRSWIKPGRVVKVQMDNRAPKRDRQGNQWRYLVTAKGNWDIGGSQIAKGYAQVDGGIRFTDRTRYLQWQSKAYTNNKGYYGTC